MSPTLFLLSAALAQQEHADTSQRRDLVPHDASELFSNSGKRWAIVIGVDEYENPDIQDLRFPAQDARSFADRLVGSGVYAAERVLVLTPDQSDPRLRPDKNNILRVLQQLKELDELESVVFFFSGHGAAEELEDGRVNYLFPEDADAGLAKDTAIPLNRILSDLYAVDAKKRFIVLDACRNQVSVGKGLQPPAWEDPRYATAEGTFILYGTAFGSYSYEYEDLGAGLLTHHLVQGMDGAADGLEQYDGVVSASELYRYVKEQMENETVHRRHTQIPVQAGENSGDIPVLVVPDWREHVLATLDVTPCRTGVLVLDGRSVGVVQQGETERIERLQPGRHELALDGEHRVVVLKEGEYLPIRMCREAATLRITTRTADGRELHVPVKVDGARVGRTPINVDLPAGSHALELGWWLTDTVDVPAGGDIPHDLVVEHRGARSVALTGAVLQGAGTALAVGALSPTCGAVAAGDHPEGWVAANAVGWGTAGLGLGLTIAGGLRWQEPEAWLVGGAGLAASGLGAALGATGISHVHADSSGTPACVVAGTTDPLRSAAILGWSAAGVGAAALGVGAWRTRSASVNIGPGWVRISGRF
ncbi:MAG: caspase family protein [Alphaproteobacteria bacterium]|nr:caspase family protein [Alphaproteobacteria bacterium]